MCDFNSAVVTETKHFLDRYNRIKFFNCYVISETIQWSKTFIRYMMLETRIREKYKQLKSVKIACQKRQNKQYVSRKLLCNCV